MECPFCAEDLSDTAVVCKSCGRDLKLVIPVIEENLALIQRAQRASVAGQPPRCRGEAQRRAVWFCATHASGYVIAPIILLLAMHYVITVQLNVPLIYLRLGTLAVPLPFRFRPALALASRVPLVAACTAPLSAWSAFWAADDNRAHRQFSPSP